MACHACGCVDGTLHSGTWVSARSSIHEYSYLRAGMRVQVTRTTYSDVTPMSLSLCSPCLAKQALVSMRTMMRALYLIWGVMTVVLAIASTSPKVGPVYWAIVITLVGGILALIVLLQVKTVRRYRSNRIVPADEIYLSNYAQAISKRAGRDSVFSPDGWAKLVEQAARSEEAADDPLSSRRVQVAIEGAAQAMRSRAPS